MPVSKLQDEVVLAIQQIAAAAVVISSDIDVEDYLEVAGVIRIGRDVTTALTAGVIARLQFSPKSTGNDCWADAITFQTAAAAAESEAVSGTVNSGQNVITVASTTNLSLQDLIFIKNSTIANSEFKRIIAVVTNTSIAVINNLLNAQTGSTVYDQAEVFPFFLPCIGFARMRLVIDNSQNATQTVCVDANISKGTV
jgi:hypothetical protein